MTKVKEANMENTEKEVERLYLNQMTREKLYKLFGLKRVDKIQDLDNWLNHTKDIQITEREQVVVETFQHILIKNIEEWNENELSLGFIGPILNMIDFKVPYKLNFFAQRPISAIISGYELFGKPDGILSSGYYSPEKTYFAFQEYKKDIDSSGDPIGQNLAAMLVGQILNEAKDIIYGCYVVGRNWYFMVLKGKEFTISKSYSADDEEIFEIIKILKALRRILFKKIGH